MGLAGQLMAVQLRNAIIYFSQVTGVNVGDAPCSVLRAPCNLELGVEMYRELYRLAGLQSGYEPYFLTVSGVKKHFGVLFKSLLTHTRCELY